MKQPGLKRYYVNGTYYVYHRATNTPLPAHLPEDHPDFLDALFEARNGIKRDAPKSIVIKNSVEDVARRYMDSHEFRALSESYQGVRRTDIARLLREKDGAIARLDYRTIQGKHIKAMMRAMAPNPANERLKTWRALGKFAAVELELIEDDPSLSAKKVKAPKSDGHTPWTNPQVKQFRDHWPIGTKHRLAFELCFWLGCRISDAVALGPGDISEDGWLEFTQQKTGGDVAVPVYRDLPRFADEADLQHFKNALRAMNEPCETFLQTAYGAMRSAKAAPGWFSEAVQEAGLPKGLTSHGLRKSRMIKHAENGATVHQISAWSGHESLKEVERYTRGADRKRILSVSVLDTGDFY
ncbi:tyrosine-type recombinase/integrase [Maritimibacter dapengensis]|uniref:Tyrosine-type recombinase/integrase n=1 Tax=Maritimibacter dapengensis TaxID=2836868 RepID=A0ABS6T5M9_9RHOB|nr:tyrosine-type recombinase/integrase [Maritimibacter dapengensis]MBV7380578.1 tyrosine-type recombinase/integrase [Maritimibacter dapengensis]